MPSRRPWLLALLVGALLLGAAGWWTWKQATHARQTDQQLQQARSALSTSQEQVTLLDGERRKLAADYDALKDRWAKSDEELKRLGKSSEEMAGELERLSRERAELQHRLEEGTQTAEHRAQRAAADRTALEAKLSDVTRASQELETAGEQLQERLQQQAGERERLGDQLMELSRAYEGLAQSTTPGASSGSSAGPPGPYDRLDSSTSWRAAIEPIDPATLPRNDWKLVLDWLLHPMRPARLDEAR